jgi:hypothetical protein
MEGAKGDLKLPGILIEAKSTEAASMALKLDWLLKIKQEALNSGRIPACAINFTLGNGQPRPNGKWVLIEESVFHELQEAGVFQAG